MNLCDKFNVSERNLVQKVHQYDSTKVKFPCMVQIKYDGVFCIAVRLKGDIVHIFSRTGKEYLSMEHLKPSLLAMMKETLTHIIIFEAYAWNLKQNTISGYARDTKKQHTELIGMVHDCLTLDEYLGKKTTCYQSRFNRLQQAHLWAWLYVVPNQIVTTFEQLYAMFSQVIEGGGEGIVIKNPKAPYSRGKRNYDLMKRKRGVSYDLEVVDVVEGIGKYAGMAGAIICRFKNNTNISVGSGLTDEQRLCWFSNKKSIVGKIVQIDAMDEIGDVLREPVFKGIRYDKDKADF